MATTGHESEYVSVAGLKGALQQYKTAISDNKLNTSLKGAANGLAELDENGKVPSAQLPSFVDDVIEGYLYNGKFYKEAAHTTEITGEGSKIYVDLTEGAGGKTYRWSGSAYVVISETIAIGTTTGTAADGKVVDDHIKDNVSHITSAERTAWNAKGSYSKPSGGIPKSDMTSSVQTSLGKADTSVQKVKVGASGTELEPSSGVVTLPAYPSTPSDVGLGNVGNFKAVSTVASQGLSTTEKSNARENIGLGSLATKNSIALADHFTPSGGSDMETSQGTPSAATAGTSYDVVTGVTLKTDSAGHVTGVSTTRQKVVSNQATDISGKQDKVAKLGSATKPLYTSAAGTFAECNTYAGGTAVTLNGTSKGANTASFYAPTGAGTSGQVLVSNGSGAPSWVSPASVEVCQDIISELS